MPTLPTPSGEITPAMARTLLAIRSQGGMIRTSTAQAAGMHPRDIYKLRDIGILIRIERGIYAIAEREQPRQPDLVRVALKAPKAVLCLVSALSYYNLTTQIPGAVYVAVPQGDQAPRLKWPPLRVFWFSGAVYKEGIQTPKVDGIKVRIYCQEKTLADCFKYRNKIGPDVCIEALRLYHEGRDWKLDDLRHYAMVDRVWKTMQPYVDSLWAGQ